MNLTSALQVLTNSHTYDATVQTEKLCTREWSSLLQSCKDSVVSCLSVVVGIEEQRVTLGPPGVCVTHTPDGDTNAVVLGQAALDHVSPVRLLRILDIELSDCTLGSSSAQSSEGSGRLRTLAGLQVSLRTDAVNGHTSRAPGLDVLDQGLRLCVRRRVEV